MPGVVGIIDRQDRRAVVSCREIAVHGFEQLRAATPTTNSEIIQTEAGRMQGRLKHASVAGLSVGFGSFSRGLISRGVYSNERVTIGFRTDRGEAARQPFGGVRIWSPGVEHQSRYVAGASFGAISVSIEDLVRYFGSDSPYSDPSTWQARNSFKTPETGGASVQVLRSIMSGFDRHARKIAPAEAEFWKKAIIESACFTIVNSEGIDKFGASPQRLVRRAQEYLDGSGGTPVHISELLSVVGASRRALHRAFEEILGISPMAYLRHRRLCEARLLLNQASSGITVSEVAFRQGFADFGRFSRYYRQLFGESPSETLKGSS